MADSPALLPPLTLAAEAAVSGPAVPAGGESPQPSPTDLFGRDAVQAEDIVRRAAGIDRIEEIRARVAGLRPDPYGKLILTLDNGQVWVQIDSIMLNLKLADDVRIRRAAMGSYLLTKVEGKRSSRVRRSQ